MLGPFCLRRAVARGATRAFLVGDMPFGSYETGVRDAVLNAMRMLKEGGVDAVKLEGKALRGVQSQVDSASVLDNRDWHNAPTEATSCRQHVSNMQDVSVRGPVFDGYVVECLACHSPCRDGHHAPTTLDTCYVYC